MTHERTTIDSELLVAQYGWVHTVARNLVRDRSRAEDVAQETVLAALATPPADARDAQRLRAWLGRVAFNLSQLAARQGARRLAREMRAARAEALSSAADHAESAGVSERIAAAILGLEEPYRTAVELRYFEGLSMADIAARTGTTELAVRKRLWRARGKLREVLESIGPEPDCLAGGRRKGFLAALLPFLRGARSGATSLPLPAALGAVLVVTLGATLWFSTDSGQQPVDRTLAQGSASTDALARGAVRVPLPGGAPEGREALDRDSRRESLPLPGTIGFVVPLPDETTSTSAAALFRGSVLDLEGLPLAGLQIVERTRPEEVLGTSASHGRFAVRLGTLPATLAARGSGHAPVRTVRVEAGMEGWEHLLVAVPAFDLGARVCDEGGRGLAGASLEIVCHDSAWVRFGAFVQLDSEVLGSALSEADGAFRLADVPLARGFSLRTTRAGFEPDERPTTALVTGEPIVLRRSGIIVSGIVRRATGEPAGGAHVRLGLARTRTDEDGRFELGVRVCLEDSALESWEEGTEPARLPHFGARLRDGRNEVELVLGQALDSISGTLVDEEGSVEAWSIAAFHMGTEEDGPGEPAAVSRTDSRGDFHLGGLSPGEYALVACEPRTLRRACVAPVASGSSRLEIRAPRADLSTSGARFATLDGAPLAGARVQLGARLGDGRSIWREALHEMRADERGGVTFSCAPATEVDFVVEHPDVGRATISVGLAPGAPLAIALPRRSHVRIEDPAAEELAVIDERGRELLVRGPVRSGSRFALQAGASPLLEVPPEARAVRLFRSGVEIGRAELVLQPGATVVVR